MKITIVFKNGEVKVISNVINTDMGNTNDVLYEAKTKERTFYFNVQQVRYIEEGTE